MTITEIVVRLIILFIVCMSIVFIIVFSVTRVHKEFINDCKRIEIGMTKYSVMSIMGNPTSIDHINDSLILTWEKSQWKGIEYGGTLTRSIRVVFKHEVVVSYSSKNLDISVFF